MRQKRLGDMLISQDLLTEEQLSEALLKQRESKERLGTVLIKEGYISETQLIEALKNQLGIDYIDLNNYNIDPEMARYIPKAFAKSAAVVPVKIVKDSLFLAMEDPLNFMAIEQAGNTSKKKIIPMIASAASVSHAINILYENVGVAEAMAQMREESGFTEDVVNAPVIEKEDEGPTIRLVNSVFMRAYTESCSDIHIEPTATDTIIRMRIDGRLHKVLTIPKDLKDSVISRIKVMAHLDIVERLITLPPLNSLITPSILPSTVMTVNILS